MDSGARLITAPDGGQWAFDPGSLCLELLTTGGRGEHAEQLRTPADLVTWLVASRLSGTAPIYPAQVHVRPSELRRIRELREVLWTVCSAVARGDQVSAAAMEFINDVAGDVVRPELDLTTGSLVWTPMTGTQILGTLAREAIELIGSGDGRLRECEAEDCGLLFVDNSRPGTRRWCSMSRCGNRDKVRAFRDRARSDPPLTS